MTRTEILDSMRALAQEQVQVDLAFTEDLGLQEGLGVDSIAVMEYVISLEDTFGIEIPDEALDDVKTVGQLADYIAKKVG